MRYIEQGIARDGSGRTVAGATVSVFLAGTSTPASIYTASTGGTAINSVTTGADGSFLFYVDDADYESGQLFDEVLSASRFASKTWYAKAIFPADRGEIYPEWFGAKGDGTTNDTAALQAALDSVPSTGGTVRLADNKTYRYSSLSITKAYTTLEGNGWGSVLKTTLSPTESTVPPIWVTASGVQLKNFQVTWVTMPTALVTGGSSIYMNNTIAIGTSEITGVAPFTLLEDILIDRVYVLGAKTHGIAIGRSHRTVVQNSRVEEIMGTGIWPYYAPDIKIINNTVHRTKDAAIDIIANGPDEWGPDDYTYNVLVQGNILTDCGIGVGLDGSFGVSVLGNMIKNTFGSAIAGQPSSYYGNKGTYITNISGNVIINPFQFYGAGAFQPLDFYNTIGVESVINIDSTSEVIAADNIITDDSNSSTLYYGLFWLSGSHVSVTGNITNTGFTQGSTFGYHGGAPTGYTDILSLTVTGNNFTTRSGKGLSNCLTFLGIGGGTFSGNYVDCGAQGLTTPQGRLFVFQYVKDLNFTGNTIKNYTEAYVNNGNSLNIVSRSNHGVWGYNSTIATSAQLEDKTHAINTTNKTVGRPVWNTTTGKTVYAYDVTDVSPWLDEGAQVAHTPK
jgi:hypothetical protein